MRHVAWPMEAGDFAGGLGGKAAALTRLVEAQFPIPEFFTVLPEAFAASLSVEQAAVFSAAQTAEGLALLLGALAPAAEVRAALLAAYDRLCPHGELVAVRSSALDEDSAGHSFAGQLDSFLFVSRAGLAEKVAAVWRSAFSERMVAYRRERQLLRGPCAPAVLVQRMIAAESSGVAFSADPVQGRRGVAVVSAVFGLGTALVSGEADADMFSVDRAGKMVSRVIAHKRLRHVQDAATAEGVRAVAVEGEQADRAAITDAQALAIAGLAWRAAAHFGRPQDIEWAIAGERLYLLQSRPITSLAGLADPDGLRQIWDNSNIAESYAGITTPLTFTFARHAYEGVYKEFCRLMGVSAATIADQHVMFANMLGLIRGRVYYNLLNWYRMLALLPGFTVNRKFMEQMMGVKEGLPEEMVAELSAATWQAKMRDGLRLVRTLGGLAVNHFTLPRQIRKFYTRLAGALAPPTVPLGEMRADELTAYFRLLERQLLTRWDAPLVNDFFAMIFYGLLRKQCAAIDPQANGRESTLQNDLLCGGGGIISTEPAKRIRSMAQLAARHPELLAMLTTADARTLERALEGYPELAGEYRAYLEKFGHRCLEELKLESPTLHDDPISLLRSIAAMTHRLAAAGEQQPDVESTLRVRAEQKVQAALGHNPFRHAMFNWILRNARARVRDRENLRFERTRLFGRVRQIFVELGRRLHAEGCLEQSRDIFFLNIEEILGFVEGTATSTNLRGLAALRKAEFAGFDGMPSPADRFETFGPMFLGNTFRGAVVVAAIPADADVRTGIGCCPGIVQGVARVITDPRGAQINQGEILIATRTDPGWIMLFPAAAGVAVEHGSLLSHSAIVAREMGIPAVVSVAGLTAWLRTGDPIELDGQRGTIRKLSAKGGG